MNRKLTWKERVARFWSYVDIQGPDDCWNWKRSTVRGGYGQFYDGEFMQLAHRFAYQLHHGIAHEKCRGSALEWQCILHSCDNPSCCNPAHLRDGTIVENNEERDMKGRTARGEICANGHKFPKGVEHPNSKVSWEIVDYIRENYVLYKYGGQRLSKEILELFGVEVDPVTILSIAKYETWIPEDRETVKPKKPKRPKLKKVVVVPEKRQFVEEDVVRIRTLKANGRTAQSIADEYGCTRECVWNVVTRKTFKQFGGPIHIKTKNKPLRRRVKYKREELPVLD